MSGKKAAPAPSRSQAPRRGASTTASIGDYIRRQRKLANISLRKMADQSGVSAGLLRQIESGLLNPSQTIVQSIARALRLSAETLYLQAGVLDPRDVEEADTVREILRDPQLTEKQREILVEIYAAFCANNEAGVRRAKAPR